MANMKIIDLPTGSPESSSFLEATQVNEQAASGRSSAKVAFNALANWIAGQGADPIEYGDLNTEDETLIGGINELHGVVGYDVYDETRTSSNKYVQGDICIHSDSLQVCTDANGAYGAWDSSKWSPTTIKALLALKADSSDVYTKTQVDTALSGKQDTLATTATITRHPNAPSSLPLAAIQRYGKLVIVSFVVKLEAGTYYELYNVTPVGAGQTEAVVLLGTQANLVSVFASGLIRFNNSVTLTQATYLIGELVYMTA